MSQRVVKQVLKILAFLMGLTEHKKCVKIRRMKNKEDKMAKTVFCHAISESMPMQVCKDEQRRKFCYGCQSETRRCVKCKKLRPIVDAYQGLCQKCVPEKDLQVDVLTAGTSFDLEQVVGRLRQVGKPRENTASVAQVAVSREKTWGERRKRVSAEKRKKLAAERKELLETFVADQEEARAGSVTQVLKLVADYFQITVGELCSSSRKKEFVMPRFIAMYLLRNVFEMSFPAVAEMLGREDHTTVMHGVHRAENFKEVGWQEDLRNLEVIVRKKMA